MSSHSSECQNSCLEPLIPKQDFSFPCSQNPRGENQKNGSCKSNTSGENPTGCWDILQALTNTSHDFRQFKNESEQVYVHPLTNRSTSSLSLEMCTETLGSETGSNIDPSLDEYSYLQIDRQKSNRIKQQKTQEFCKKIKYNSSFPPPLTSISGNDGVKLQAYRGGSRLVIKAFNFSASRIRFKAERENGRLRLFLLQNDYRHREHELAEKLEQNGGKFGRKRESAELTTSRCNGEGNGSKKLPSLLVCVALS